MHGAKDVVEQTQVNMRW